MALAILATNVFAGDTITIANYNANVLPWGKGTDFIEDTNGKYWVTPKYFPPISVTIEGIPILPRDFEVWVEILDNFNNPPKDVEKVCVKYYNWFQRYIKLCL